VKGWESWEGVASYLFLVIQPMVVIIIIIIIIIIVKYVSLLKVQMFCITLINKI